MQCLKARIRNIAKEKKLPAQIILQNFMFERLLIRLSQSEYKDKFIVKGGMLVAAIVSIDNRTTMDLDTTIKNMFLTQENIKKFMDTICNMILDDGVYFTYTSISPIREDDVYSGYRIMVNASYESIDMTTGDAITPQLMKYTFIGLFDKDLSFDLWTYNIETILAEKVETILRRNVLNARPRDFYDVYILYKTQVYDAVILKKAFNATVMHCKTREQIGEINQILNIISQSNELETCGEIIQNSLNMQIKYHTVR